MPDCDALVIGSGPAGALAAQALVEAGLTVIMLDGGHDAAPGPVPPDANFAELRRTDPGQHRWFLGEDLSGIPVDGLTGGLGGGQVSGNRGYVVRDADRLLPLELKNCQVIQSLAKGGLGAAWGAACAVLDAEELKALGLPYDEMMPHYDAVIASIGVSGDPVRPGIQPKLNPDHHAARALLRHAKHKAWFDGRGIGVGQPLSAVLTKDFDGRKATTYADMEYWADPGRSVWRPQYTVEALQARPNFEYRGGFVADRIEETGNETTVYAHGTGSVAGIQTISAKRVVLAAGAVNTARILLRSKGLYDARVPFVGKPHAFSACVDFSSLGKAGPDARSSLCQLLVTDRERRDGLEAGCAQLYSYRSLLLFRLLGSVPLALPQAMDILAALSPSLVIADVRFPAFATLDNTLRLKRNGTVEICMKVREDEREARDRSWKRLRRALSKLGLPVVKNMRLPEASSSHYAGTVPMSSDDRLPLSADAHGKVRGMSRVWAADASVFPRLPAKPHTLTMMANARRVALAAVKV